MTLEEVQLPIRTLRLTAAATALVLVAACGPEPREAPTDSDQVRERALEAQTARRRTGAEIQDRALNRVISAVYLCGSAERLSVDFDNPRQMATVRTSRGEAFDLYQERAASGIWYRATGHELRGKGNEATWTAAGRDPVECRAVD
ncbi:MliC family protein [Brevundimonas diminuta]|uniref:MliC family protein n=1 Tax=Brevundimonas diminuta TaxID=293 RepID=UPI003D07594A